MRALYKYIKDYIEANIPDIDCVKRYRNQNQLTKDREESTIGNAVYIELDVQETFNRVFGIKDHDLIVRFHFLLEGYDSERDDQVDLITAFDKEMQGFRGADSDPVQFTSFEEVLTDYDDDFDMLESSTLEYKTHYRNLSAYKLADSVVHTATPIVTNEIA